MPAARVADTFGLKFAHIYTRDLAGHLDGTEIAGGTSDSNGELELSIDVEFREKPPGMLLYSKE